MSTVSIEPCRYDMGCWRPLCPYGHSGRSRAARWAALWSLLAEQEAQAEDVPVPQIVEDAVTIIPKEHISERIIEQVHDVPVPQIQELILDVAEIPPQTRIPERIVEHFRERISERTVLNISLIRLVLRSREKLWMMLKAFRKRALLSTLLNKSPVYQYLEFRNKLWKSRRSFRKRALLSTLLNKSPVYQCLRSTSRLWKSSSIFPRSVSRNVLPYKLSKCQRLRSWKRSSRRFRSHMNECNSEQSLNQVTKHVEFSQTQYINKVAAVPTVIQRQALRFRQWRRLWKFRQCSSSAEQWMCQ